MKTRNTDESIALDRINEELEASYEQLKAATDQLYESELKYKLLIDNMTDIVWITDDKGVITFINDEIENVLGYKKEEVLYMPIYNVMCPLHQYEGCKNIIEEFNRRDFYREELWMLHHDGTTRKVIETNTKRIYSNNQLVGIQGVGRDITERIRMERQLNKKNNQLSIINEISSAISSSKISMNINKLFQTISQKIVETINVPLCTIRLIKEDGKLHCMSAEGRLKDRVNLAPIVLDRALISAAIINNDTQKIIQAGRHYISEHNRHNLESRYLDNMVFVPLCMDKQPIGVLTICCMDGYDEEYIDMLASVANNIVFAIEKTDLYSEIKQNYLRTIKALVAAIEVKDTYTQGHSFRVSQYAVKIAKELNMTEEEIEEIEIAGILHDIGKIGISDSILTKPGKLEPEEFRIIQEHPVIGCHILNPIGLSDNIIKATLLHHKRFDLKGYPEDTAVEELTLHASIIGVADAFDAMTTQRSYKSPITWGEAVQELKRHSGTQFNPAIVAVMEKLFVGNQL